MATGATVVNNSEGADSVEGGAAIDKQKWTGNRIVYTRKKSFKNSSAVPEAPAQNLAPEPSNSTQKQLISRLDAASEDSSCLNRALPINGELIQGNPNLEKRVKFDLSLNSKQDRLELKRKLNDELVLVRSTVRRIDGDSNNVGAKRVQSEVASVGDHREPSKPLNQLSIPVIENSQIMSDSFEKEKRTPKANQFYRNSEFLLAKDKFPPESNKKSKSNGKKVKGREISAKMLKSCSLLLERLMKHKHGWVFNEPVDPKALGLIDYFTIIKHPMDLGTVKSRLNTLRYKSPKEFAEDVRLTFSNAMTYNPVGQDVHTMAGLLSGIFEEKWVVIESEYNHELRAALDHDAGAPTPTSKRALERSESMSHQVDRNRKHTKVAPIARTPVPQKPKAKDLNKRDMTYEEKQKLSTNLQSLPSEKLDNIVQIIKKNNSALSQNDEEIEVDIDSVDNETLWELDRFVTNYKKCLSKHKRRAELGIQARPKAKKNIPTSNGAKKIKETITGEKNDSLSSPVQGEKQGDGASRSSSSSSSSDSESSSSGSESDSSSAGGSEARRSPKA